MTEARDEQDRGIANDEGQDESGLIRSVEDESEAGAGQGYEQDSGPDPEGVQPPGGADAPEGDPTVSPEPGGYAGRDPKTDMPAMPSVPESQEDTLSHEAAPDPDKPERNASE